MKTLKESWRSWKQARASNKKIAELEAKITQLESRVHAIEVVNMNLEDLYKMIVVSMGQKTEMMTEFTESVSTAIVGLSARITLLETPADENKQWKA